MSDFKLDTRDMIEVTGVDLRKLVQAVYRNSRPQGLGMLHFKEGDLSSEEVEEIVGDVRVSGVGSVLRLDYVNGRACKFGLFRDENGGLWIQKAWYDHSELDLRRMLKEAGVKEATA